MISIIMPSWDDYKYLKPCLESITRVTQTKYEILIHLNTFNDELLKLASKYDPGYTRSIKNEGIAYGTNRCAERAIGDYLYFPNSDMIFLPGWDIALLKAIEICGNNNVYSSTMIEPEGANPHFIIKNYGREPEELKLDNLLRDLEGLRKHQLIVCHTVPFLCPRDLFVHMDENMWPGWVTDNDVAVSMFTQDPDIKFIRTTDSLLYHFMCKSTYRIGTPEERWNLGLKAKQIFNTKWPKVYPGMNDENYRQFIYKPIKENIWVLDKI